MSVAQKHELTRHPYMIHYKEESSFLEVYGRQPGTVTLAGQYMEPVGVPRHTVFVFMHPIGIMEYLPFTNALAAQGAHVLCTVSRYPRNDTALIMEKVVADLGAHVRYAREELGFTRVILVGWSGGGSLMMFYQNQAENPTITETPAGDPYSLAAAGLASGDGMIVIAAHTNRAVTLTEWTDASIIDETDLSKRNVELNLYDPANPNQPPYSQDFLEAFEKAQIARNRKITTWVREQLDGFKTAGRPNEELGFVVHGTMAAPCWLDPAVEPNDRKPGTCGFGDPQVVNMSPIGIARFSSLRSWLSQWSYDDAVVDAPKSAAKITIPVLVVQNSADDLCVPSQAARIFAAIGHDNKEFKEIKDATHYYYEQPDKCDEACGVCIDWVQRQGLWE